MAGKVALTDLFKAIDRMDADAFVAYLSEDAVFRYGSQAAVRGKAAVRDYVAGFFATLKGLRHRVIATWEGKGSLVCQGEASYTRQDGKQVTVPFVNVLLLEGEKIHDYLVYVDPTPLVS
jgi:ketosteroid isomerase-like protein